MNPLTIMVWSTTLLTLFFIATVFYLRAKIEDRKALNILMERQLLDAREERDTWKETCHNGMERDTHRKEVVAVLKKQVTNQAEQIDALLNGDRHCVKHHRYYTGQGISCPHCGGEEVTVGPIPLIDARSLMPCGDAEAGIDIRSFEMTFTSESPSPELTGSCECGNKATYRDFDGRSWCDNCLPF